VRCHFRVTVLSFSPLWRTTARIVERNYEEVLLKAA
jgi:hypothetical protein